MSSVVYVSVNSRSCVYHDSPRCALAGKELGERRREVMEAWDNYTPCDRCILGERIYSNRGRKGALADKLAPFDA